MRSLMLIAKPFRGKLKVFFLAPFMPDRHCGRALPTAAQPYNTPFAAKIGCNEGEGTKTGEEGCQFSAGVAKGEGNSFLCACREKVA